MGFGAVITSGAGFTPIDDAVMRRVSEVRVEQELSKPTAFAIRFEDDLADGDTIVANRAELQSNQPLGIFVKAGDTYECLVHGPARLERCVGNHDKCVHGSFPVAKCGEFNPQHGSGPTSAA